MATQDEVGICNYGLTGLSTSRIESLDQNNENARKCNAIFTFERDALLEDHDWGFARKEATLALLATSPTTEDWEYQYQLPGDLIAIRHMESDLLYKQFGDTIYTNHTTPKIQYTYRVTNAALFTPLFSIALSHKIAEKLAFGITQNASMAAESAKQAKKAVDMAKWSDAQQGISNVPIVGDLITERQI